MGRSEYQVVDSQTGEVLWRDVKFERFPCIIEGLWIRFFRSGQTICYGESDRRQALYESVLIPKKSN